MEHVEVLRDLSECCRAAIKAGDWKVDGACDPDAVLRRADAAIAALSAPKPRMVGCEGDDGLLRTHPEAETCDVCAPKPEPAESAPVGVIEDAIRHLTNWLDMADCECESGHQCGRTEVHRTRDQLRALSQQPAADSRICRVCDGGPGNDGSCLCGHRKWEQPAAVDEATKLLRAYRGAPKFSNDHNAIKRTCALEDEIDLFLAGQHQEPTT